MESWISALAHCSDRFLILISIVAGCGSVVGSVCAVGVPVVGQVLRVQELGNGVLGVVPTETRFGIQVDSTTALQRCVSVATGVVGRAGAGLAWKDLECSWVPFIIRQMARSASSPVPRRRSGCVSENWSLMDPCALGGALSLSIFAASARSSFSGVSHMRGRHHLVAFWRFGVI